jgi:hypothetical protein
MGDSTIIARSASSSGQGGTTPGGSAQTSTPFGGTPWAVPGTVQMEDFDEGGEGVAYHDTDAVNSGGTYRPSSGVDIENTAGGGWNLGWVAPGEWLSYTVNISAAGSYTAQSRVAAYGTGGMFHLEIDGVNVTGAVTVPDTGWWQNWQTISRTVTLPAGRHVAKLVMDSSGVNAVGNFDWFSLSSAASTSTAALTLPGRINAASFDAGAEGVAYHDTSAGNAGGAFRSGDVDIEASSEGGYDIGWIDPGEWLRYTVNVASAGTYQLRFRVASPTGAGALHVDANGRALTGTIAIPSTGGWQSWTTITRSVTLAAGQQTLTVGFDAAGINLAYIDVVAP